MDPSWSPLGQVVAAGGGSYHSPPPTGPVLWMQLIPPLSSWVRGGCALFCVLVRNNNCFLDDGLLLDGKEGSVKRRMDPKGFFLSLLFD